MYKSIAKYYDLLGWDEFHAIALPRLKPLLIDNGSKTYLDLACGTGMLACSVATMGLEVVGLDKSRDMLKMAAHRMRLYRGANKPTIIYGDMTRFNLHRQFDAVGCFFDAANHIVDPERFEMFISSAAAHVKSGGFFMFDVNTPIGLNCWDALLFTREGQHAVMMKGEYERSTRLASITIHGFVRLPGGKVDKFRETFHERGYTHTQIMSLLRRSGFSRITAIPQNPERTLRNAHRVFYTAYKR